MSEPAVQQEPDEAKNVEVKFVVSYNTAWGQTLIVTGSRGLLGAGDVGKGIKMHCVQAQHGLSWVGSVTVPPGYGCTYRYVVYDEHSGEVVARESSPHELYVSRTSAGSCIMLSDQFQVRCRWASASQTRKCC